ncbi:unnamed protein product [Acanthosepion pharaonis]|uniref:Uncharacterized protein n=1 Tax=Acanthosepion pharaonis TaxID=158019 RepID=A0A812DL95_ACAPH|nr:unnamed protein product [Sepia pharaonis]
MTFMFAKNHYYSKTYSEYSFIYTTTSILTISFFSLTLSASSFIFSSFSYSSSSSVEFFFLFSYCSSFCFLCTTYGSCFDRLPSFSPPPFPSLSSSSSSSFLFPFVLSFINSSSSFFVFTSLYFCISSSRFLFMFGSSSVSYSPTFPPPPTSSSVQFPILPLPSSLPPPFFLYSVSSTSNYSPLTHS